VAAVALQGCGDVPVVANTKVKNAVVRDGVGSQTLETTNVSGRPQVFSQSIVRRVGSWGSGLEWGWVDAPAKILTATGDCTADGTAVVFKKLGPGKTGVCPVTYVASYTPSPDSYEVTVTLDSTDATNGSIETQTVTKNPNGRTKLSGFDVGDGATFSERAIH
jgi:hypothetical protein